MTTTLAEVCTITMGQAPTGDSYNARGEGLPLIAGAGDFKGEALAPTKFTTKPGKVSKPGDIVLSIRASIGAKVWADGEYCLGRGVAGLRPGPELDDKYLWHWLTRYERDLASKGRGATFLQVNKTDIGEMPIMVPALAEQRRIAAILDHADALRAKRRQILAHLDALTQAIFNDMFGTAAWDSTLVDIADVQIGPFGSLLHREDYVSDGVPVINPMHIRDGQLQPDGEFSVSENKAASLSTYRLCRGDVVLGRRGEMGRAGIAGPQHVGMLCGTGSLILRPRGADSRFLHSVVTSSRMKGHLERSSLGATLPNLNATIVKASPVPQAPADAQAEFAERLAAAEATVGSARRAANVDDDLFVSLQSRAFRGEL